MKGLRRVIAAPWLVAVLWAAQVLVAMAVGGAMRVSTIAALEPFGIADDGHQLGAIGELMAAHPSLGASAASGLALVGLTGLLAWTLVSGLVIARLDGHHGSELGERWLRTLPGGAITSLWHVALRIALWIIVFASVGPLPPPIAVPVLVATLVVSTLALDLARVQVVLHGARGFHIRTAAYAFVQAVRHWPLLLRIAGPWLLQMLVVGASLWLALASLDGHANPWLVRGLSLLAVTAGFWRVALVVEAGEIPLERPDGDD